MKVWKVEPAGRRAHIKLTCPWKDCGGVIWVAGTLRRGPDLAKFETAPCLHCFKTSKLPTDGG